jgi:polyisoprenoid-binding protein YceI
MTWVIDPAHTLVEFSVKHMMITTVRGRFTRFTGTLNIDDQRPERSTVEGTIEAASIDTHEPNRDNHLRSADFFDAEKYPLLTFRSRRIEPAGDGAYKIIGDITIKDVTREIVFKVTDEGQGKNPWGKQVRAFSAQATLNRKDFGLNWNVALETGGWLVGDQVKITIELELVEQEAEQPAAESATA